MSPSLEDRSVDWRVTCGNSGQGYEAGQRVSLTVTDRERLRHVVRIWHSSSSGYRTMPLVAASLWHASDTPSAA